MFCKTSLCWIMNPSKLIAEEARLLSLKSANQDTSLKPSLQ
uniref:Uncharacterized protein n=1 Tax=Arundo donax TaxID=35708 RepID=A0A0A9EQ54_ARUDO